MSSWQWMSNRFTNVKYDSKQNCQAVEIISLVVKGINKSLPSETWDCETVFFFLTFSLFLTRPKVMHILSDSFRFDKGGKSTHSIVMRVLRLHKKHLTVIIKLGDELDQYSGFWPDGDSVGFSPWNKTEKKKKKKNEIMCQASTEFLSALFYARQTRRLWCKIKPSCQKRKRRGEKKPSLCNSVRKWWNTGNG